MPICGYITAAVNLLTEGSGHQWWLLEGEYWWKTDVNQAAFLSLLFSLRFCFLSGSIPRLLNLSLFISHSLFHILPPSPALSPSLLTAEPKSVRRQRTGKTMRNVAVVGERDLSEMLFSLERVFWHYVMDHFLFIPLDSLKVWNPTFSKIKYINR